MDEHGVARPAIVGTQALREARNAADFAQPAEAILGAPIEIICGAREAELAFTAVARTFPDLAGSAVRRHRCRRRLDRADRHARRQ